MNYWIQRAIAIHKTAGWLGLIRATLRWFATLGIQSWYCLRYVSVRNNTFRFQGKSYDYFRHTYQSTWRNERIIEIPIVWDYVRNYLPDQILEVGNVLSHYFAARHRIVDKYEIAERVINRDVVDLNFSERFSLIVTISILEHVGWDESPKEQDKILRAVESLKRCLAPGGKIVMTLPIGYNPWLDEILEKEQIQFSNRHCMKRISRSNRWVEVPWEAIKGAKFNFPFSGVNGLVVGIIG